jgi:hypothetical protein
MLPETASVRFLVALPFTMGFAKKQVESEAKDIDCVENAIVVGQDTVLGVTKRRSWNPETDVYVHVYLNPDVAVQSKNKLYARVQRLMDKARQDPEKSRRDPDVKKYLIVRKSDKNSSGYTIKIRSEVVSGQLATSGWLVLASNHVGNLRKLSFLTSEANNRCKIFRNFALF